MPAPLHKRESEILLRNLFRAMQEAEKPTLRVFNPLTHVFDP